MINIYIYIYTYIYIYVFRSNADGSLSGGHKWNTKPQRKFDEAEAFLDINNLFPCSSIGC